MSRNGAGRLEGQAAIITGGASGIGSAVATRLVGEGVMVAVADLSAERARQTAETLAAGRPGARVIGLEVDVRREDQVEAMKDRVLDEFGRIDILVASAGILRGVPGKPQTLAETTAEQVAEHLSEIRVDGVEGFSKTFARFIVDLVNGLLSVAYGIEQVLPLRVQELLPEVIGCPAHVADEPSEIAHDLRKPLGSEL